MHTLPARVESRMHVAAKVLTTQLQDHAERRGIPAELVGHLTVNWDGTHFATSVDDPTFQGAYDDHEWGSITQPPVAFARTFEPKLHEAFLHSFDHALRAHLSGDR